MSQQVVKRTLSSIIQQQQVQQQQKYDLLILYKQLLRSAETFPSKNRLKIYQAIREEWREFKTCTDTVLINKQITVAYKGLDQLRQYDVQNLTKNAAIVNATTSSTSTANTGTSTSTAAVADWSVTLDKNPMPKPHDYDERKKLQQQQQKELEKDI